ncbi:MAG: hypothetical protein AABZ39_09065 [Spirochaetota bacterium]
MEQIKRFVLMLALTSLAPLFAELAPIIKKHPIDLKKLGGELNELWKVGYFPAGIEVIEKGAERGIYLVYREDKNFEIDDWKIIPYPIDTDLDTPLESEKMKEWVAIDIGYTASQVYILYLKIKPAYDAFYQRTVQDTGEMTRAIEGYHRSHHRCYGVSFKGSEVTVLMLRLIGMTYGLYEYEEFDNILAAGTAIVQRTKDGWDIWGFAFTPDQKVGFFMLR